MRRHIITYGIIFLMVFAGSLAFVLPGITSDSSSVEASPLSEESVSSFLKTAEGIDLDEQLIPDRFPIRPSQPSVQNPDSLDSINENLRKIEELYRFIDRNFIHELDHDRMYEYLVDSLFSALDDPYSAYIPEDKSSRITDTTTGMYGGIGAYISKPDPAHRTQDPASYMVTVVAPFPSSPAHRAGLHAGDLISHIDGEEVDALTAEEASRRLRGEPKTDVTVTIYRSDEVSYDVVITRDIVTVPTVQYDMIDGNIAYLKILQFTPITPEKVLEALESFREEGYDSLIIDMRQNPGGEFNAVRRIADYFLSEGTIVSTESRVPGQSRIYQASAALQVPKDIPVVILVDRGSASGSEILSGALQDNERALVIGERTFGKGYVQGVYPFDRDFFKLTISKYVTPNRQDIEASGISPDIIVETDKLTDEESKAASDLLRSKKLEAFADENPEMDDAPIEQFVTSLQDEGYELSSRYMQMLIIQEYHRRMDFPPIYNLEFDDVLKRGIEELQR